MWAVCMSPVFFVSFVSELELFCLVLKQVAAFCGIRGMC
jgi:hypothetical protein